MIELARQHGSRVPVRLARIAKTHGIPYYFLVKVLLQLKNAGLVMSTRGAAGGYQLSRDPAQIVLADVVAAIEPPWQWDSGSLGDTPASRVLQASWREAIDAYRHVLETITLDDLLERVRGQSENMYYI